MQKAQLDSLKQKSNKIRNVEVYILSIEIFQFVPHI